MTISGTRTNLASNAWIPDTLTRIHDLVNQSAQQLTTGKVANTYSELGKNVTRSIDLNAQLSHIETNETGIGSAKLSLSLINQAMTSFNDLAANASSGPLSPVNATDFNSRKSTQSDLRAKFSSMLDYLNTKDGESYIFAGRSASAAPVLDAATILDGNNTAGKAGLSSYVAERQMADLGASGLGRLVLSLDTSTARVSLAKEATNPVFGLSINSVSSGLDQATAMLSGPLPQSLEVTFSGVPTIGTAMTVNLGLPDESSTDITLTASSSAGANQFAIGTDAASTATNFKNALTTALSDKAQTTLLSTSALKAAKDFFSASLTAPPQRVLMGNDGTAATATGYQTDAATNLANTVVWYLGTGVSPNDDPRLDRNQPIAADLSIGIGARGNESGFADTLAPLAAAAVYKFSTTSETTAQSQFIDLINRSKNGLAVGKGELQSMMISFASVQMSVKSAHDQNIAKKNVLNTMLSSLVDTTPEKAAAELTQLQTQLQIAYQVTAKVMKMSLADYL